MKYMPLEIIDFSDTALQITWEDGHESIYLYEDLRESCPCANCREVRKKESKGNPTFKKNIPLRANFKSLRLIKTEKVGQYALRFKWSDNHDTGIYSFDFLRELCTCESCQV